MCYFIDRFLVVVMCDLLFDVFYVALAFLQSRMQLNAAVAFCCKVDN